MNPVSVREFCTEDFAAIQFLSQQEGWPTPVERPAEGLKAWQQSNVRLVAEHDGQIVGFVRGLTDLAVTMYIAEILVKKDHRGKGIGTALLEECQRLHPTVRIDLLSAEASDGFYLERGFRTFSGFRRSPGWDTVPRKDQ